MTDDHRDPRVDEYIDALPDWQQEICRHARELVHAADPDVQETIKRRVQPYFVLQGNVCALLAAKQHVCVFLYDGAIVADPHRIITGGHGNSTARQISIHQGETINAPALQAMFAEIIANNRAGGWRRIKAGRASASGPVKTSGAASTSEQSPTHDTAPGGLLLGFALWIGFPLVLQIGAIVHERTPIRLAAIHAGDWLLKLPAVAVLAAVLQQIPADRRRHRHSLAAMAGGPQAGLISCSDQPLPSGSAKKAKRDPGAPSGPRY